MNYVIFTSASIAITAILRIGLAQQAHCWTQGRYFRAEGEAYYRGCEGFHEIMAEPKPWYVRLNTWLEDKHV